MNVSELILDGRTERTLKYLGITTVAQLSETPDKVFLATPNFGRKSLKELRKIVPFVPEAERLRNAAENVVIAYGMGWDMDGVIEALKAALGFEQNAQIEHKTLPDNT